MIYPVAIESSEAFGAASLESQTIRPPSIFIPEPVAIHPAAIDAGSFGPTLVGAALAPTGFGGEAFGQSTLKIQVLPAAIASAEAFGAVQCAPADWSIAVLPVQ